MKMMNIMYKPEEGHLLHCLSNSNEAPDKLVQHSKNVVEILPIVFPPQLVLT